MPAAKCCGQQVDHNPGLLVRGVCNHLIHPACVNLSQVELEFYATSNAPYNCQECLSDRRNSRSASTPLLPLTSLSSDVLDNAAESSQAVGIGNATLQSNDDTLINFDDSTAVDATILAQLGNSSGLALIFQELVKLRALHNDLHTMVEALREDNVALKADNEALKADNVVFKKDNMALKADNANMLSQLSLVQDKMDTLMAVIEAPVTEVKSPKRKKTAGNKSAKSNSNNEPFPALTAPTESPSAASYSHVIRSRLNPPINSNSATKSNFNSIINANSVSNTPSNANLRTRKKQPIVVGQSKKRGS